MSAEPAFRSGHVAALVTVALTLALVVAGTASAAMVLRRSPQPPLDWGYGLLAGLGLVLVVLLARLLHRLARAPRAA